MKFLINLKYRSKLQYVSTWEVNLVAQSVSVIIDHKDLLIDIVKTYFITLTHINKILF